MCEPVSTTSLVLGGLSAATGAASAIGGAQSQQQQANAQYAANKAQRQGIINNQRSKLTLDTARFHRRQTDRDRADTSAGRAASEAYLGNQGVYNDKVKSYLSSKQERMIKSLTAGGQMAARGQRGGSMEMMQVANDAALGRDNATALANLRSASTKLISDNRGIKEKLQGEYEQNYSRVGDEPTQGFTPPEVAKPAGPNPLSIAAAIGQVGLNAYGTVQGANTLSDGTTQRQAGGGNPYTGNNFTNYDSGFNF